MKESSPLWSFVCTFACPLPLEPLFLVNPRFFPVIPPLARRDPACWLTTHGQRRKARKESASLIFFFSFFLLITRNKSACTKRKHTQKRPKKKTDGSHPKVGIRRVLFRFIHRLFCFFFCSFFVRISSAFWSQFFQSQKQISRFLLDNILSFIFISSLCRPPCISSPSYISCNSAPLPCIDFFVLLGCSRVAAGRLNYSRPTVIRVHRNRQPSHRLLGSSISRLLNLRSLSLSLPL